MYLSNIVLKKLFSGNCMTLLVQGTQGIKKLITNLKKYFRCPSMKRETMKYVVKCLDMFILHGLPKKIINERDEKFTSNFSKSLFTGMDTKLNFSTSYYPHTNGKTKRVNNILEDMLRMYVMSHPNKWEYYIYLVEFSYMNSFQASF